MDVKSGYPFWAIKNGLLHDYPRLERDLRVEVAVVGAGVTGALIADELARHDHEVAVLEQLDVGWGSTAASTALLQYEIDETLTRLARRFGEADAVLAYRACAEAIPRLQAVAADVRGSGFERTRSLYFASRSAHLPALRAELAMRARHGLPVRWFDSAQVRARYGFDAPGAILSLVSARVDPYLLCHRLLARLQRRGTGVYAHSRMCAIKPGTRGVELVTEHGATVRCRHLILAAGYSSQEWLRERVACNRSTYAFVTDPADPAELGPLRKLVAWETARPYLYFRSTRDGRLMVGGQDDDVDVPARRDARVDGKARQLCARMSKLFPQLRMRPAFAWGGTFAETSDGLPYFGPHAQYGPRVHFAMAYGGNGITYAMLGAGLLRALVEKRRHPLGALFSFARRQRRPGAGD
jgi:glycine/D-amino acid oxidase-like deaminating enzyme